MAEGVSDRCSFDVPGASGVAPYAGPNGADAPTPSTRTSALTTELNGV